LAGVTFVSNVDFGLGSTVGLAVEFGLETALDLGVALVLKGPLIFGVRVGGIVVVKVRW
jgi:hypothetical protein